MSEVKRYFAKHLRSVNTGHAVTGLSHEVVMSSDYAALEAECKKLRPLAEDRDQQYDMKVKARAQRDAALAECEKLRELLLEAKAAHGVMIMTDPPQEAWKARSISERIDAALSTKT